MGTPLVVLISASLSASGAMLWIGSFPTRPTDITRVCAAVAAVMAVTATALWARSSGRTRLGGFVLGACVTLAVSASFLSLGGGLVRIRVHLDEANMSADAERMLEAVQAQGGCSSRRVDSMKGRAVGSYVIGGKLGDAEVVCTGGRPGIQFSVEHAGSGLGFGYFPYGPPTNSPSNIADRYEHVDGPWYQWEYSAPWTEGP